MKKRPLYETSPADTAKSLGLIYGGFAAWLDPNTRKKKAETIDGKLVKVEDDEDGERENDLGNLVIFVLDPAVVQRATEGGSSYTNIYEKLFKAILKNGEGELLVLIERSTEIEVAKYFNSIGVSTGVKLTPLDSFDPSHIHEVVVTKITEGYTHIDFFDTDEINIRTVESLKAPYNKKEISIETHQLTKMGGPSK